MGARQAWRISLSMKKPHKISLVKGLLAGVAGGLAGSAAKIVAEKLFPPRTQGQPEPPELIVERVAHAAGEQPSETAKQVAGQGIHWGFGTMLGGVYGVAAELSPGVTSWRGSVFGLTVNRLAHKGLLPGLDLIEPVPQQPAQERVSEWVSHVVYGVTTDLVRRAVRKRL
jgi:putative membrane protein